MTTTTHLPRYNMQLDGKLIKKDGHDYLMEVFDFPDYYGKNLDALYDCLTEICCDVTLINSCDVDDDLLQTFVDAASDNELFNFEIIS